MLRSFFITGTDTGIGKTHVMSQLIKKFLAEGQRVLALKPIESGAEGGSQEHLVYQQAGLPEEDCRNLHLFPLPIAPHLAARAVGVTLSASAISTWCQQQRKGHDVLLIEGAGGLMVPLNDNETWLDVIQLLAMPVIWVVGIRLGCINHALLTERCLLQAGCKIEGWIANFLDPECLYPEQVLQTLQRLLQSPCIGRLEYSKAYRDPESEP